MVETVITIIIAIIALVAVGGLIASNMYLIKMLNRKLLVEKAETIAEVKVVEDDTPQAQASETFEIPAYH